MSPPHNVCMRGYQQVTMRIMRILQACAARVLIALPVAAC